ncbi:MAG TPA: NnrU family protein [Steroidobacteraceae bacterium]|nr:NnrU family protein [Steroidobacteraceae bacterium]
MTTLIIGLCLFLGMHSIAIVAPALRASMRDRLGERAWKAVYALASLIGFVLIVHGFALARTAPIVLYTPPPWMRHVTFLLMLPVFPLLLAAYLPGRIKTATKHPLLAAVKFWAVAHLLMNGRLADVLLFGGFLVWAVLDRISLRRRPSRAAWSAPAGRWNDAIAVVLGLGLYVFFVAWAHLRLFGVSPLG